MRGWGDIDKPARKELALCLRRFATGKITNDEFEDAMCDIKTKDEGVECLKDALWFLYDDLREYKAIGKDKLHKDTKKYVARIILFLQSELEYPYPKVPPFYGLLNLLTLGVFSYFTNKKFERAGEVDFYPFKSKIDFENCKKNPKFLNTKEKNLSADTT